MKSEVTRTERTVPPGRLMPTAPPTCKALAETSYSGCCATSASATVPLLSPTSAPSRKALPEIVIRSPISAPLTVPPLWLTAQTAPAAVRLRVVSVTAVPPLPTAQS